MTAHVVNQFPTLYRDENPAASFTLLNWSPSKKLQTPDRDENPAGASSPALFDQGFHYPMRENLTSKEKYTIQEETMQFDGWTKLVQAGLLSPSDSPHNIYYGARHTIGSHEIERIQASGENRKSLK